MFSTREQYSHLTIYIAFAISKMLYILEASYAQFIKQKITL